MVTPFVSRLGRAGVFAFGCASVRQPRAGGDSGGGSCVLDGNQGAPRLCVPVRCGGVVRPVRWFRRAGLPGRGGSEGRRRLGVGCVRHGAGERASAGRVGGNSVGRPCVPVRYSGGAGPVRWFGRPGRAGRACAPSGVPTRVSRAAGERLGRRAVRSRRESGRAEAVRPRPLRRGRTAGSVGLPVGAARPGRAGVPPRSSGG